MVINSVAFLQKGVKVLLNPGNEYFEQLQEWISETERWNYRRDEYRLWRSTFDKFWLYLAVDEESDEIISSVSLALQYTTGDEPLYSIGNYYCVPEWRGKGISSQLFKMAMKVAESHNTTLYGAKLMSDLYAKRFNFSKMNTFWHNFAEIDGSHLTVPNTTPTGFFCKKIAENDWPKLHDYDEQLCQMRRRKFMRKNLTMIDTIARCVYDEKSQKIVGFGALKLIFANEIMLSPLYADCYEAAVVLVSSLLESIPDLKIFDSLVVIYPDVNRNVPRLLSLISNNHFESHPTYRAQYTKALMQFQQENIYANDECSHSPA